ncbi:hypothetical protein SUGI_1087040 [Cryptomeria japonica]|nr:hypothetical protein SUGI_1087040 [Cryptomeria japonica]
MEGSQESPMVKEKDTPTAANEEEENIEISLPDHPVESQISDLRSRALIGWERWHAVDGRGGGIAHPNARERSDTEEDGKNKRSRLAFAKGTRKPR